MASISEDCYNIALRSRRLHAGEEVVIFYGRRL
jgi:hypothetical protein